MLCHYDYITDKDFKSASLYKAFLEGGHGFSNTLPELNNLNTLHNLCSMKLSA